MFLPENRDKYDVLVFYHMWQSITSDQEKMFADCIKEGKPVVALHHSICAFDDWEEYWHILGGKYFHKPTVIDGRKYAACTYMHDRRFMVNVKDKNDRVTKGVRDFEIYDETYKGYYVEKGVKQLLTTTDSTSTPVIGWSKKYGKARIVVLQSGHATPTFQNASFRQLLRQAIEWVFAGSKK
jgi:type 1 glutamine amidotransferase